MVGPIKLFYKEFRVVAPTRSTGRVKCKHVIKSVYEFLICINLFSKALGFKARDLVLTVSRVIVAVYLGRVYLFGLCARKGRGKFNCEPANVRN